MSHAESPTLCLPDQEGRLSVSQLDSSTAKSSYADAMSSHESAEYIFHQPVRPVLLESHEEGAKLSFSIKWRLIIYRII